jgi:hypothetical protein
MRVQGCGRAPHLPDELRRRAMLRAFSCGLHSWNQSGGSDPVHQAPPILNAHAFAPNTAAPALTSIIRSVDLEPATQGLSSRALGRLRPDLRKNLSQKLE